MERIQNELLGLHAQVEQVDYRKRGYHLDVNLSPGEVRGFASIMRENGFYLVFVTAVHLSPAIEVVYQFAIYSNLCRVVGRAAVAEDNSIPTISDIFDGANWHERETWEMYGVKFVDHPYLEPLLLPEESVGINPLLKEEGKVKEAVEIRWKIEAGN